MRCYALRHERLTRNAAAAAATSNGIGGDLRRGDAGVAGPDTRKDSLAGLGSGGSGIGGGSGSGFPVEVNEGMPDQVFFQSHNMRLQHPDDELGGNLLLVLPQVRLQIDRGTRRMQAGRGRCGFR